MDYVLAKRYGLEILVIEDPAYHDCWVLVMRPYQWFIDKWRPPFRYFAGMKIEVITEKEALAILKDHVEDSARGGEVSKIIKMCEEMPF